MANPTDETIAKEIAVGEVVARSGVANSAIHFGESKGPTKSWRTSGNQRRYAREVLRRRDWGQLSKRWQSDLDDRITRLTKLRDQLTSFIRYGCLSLDSCPPYNPGDGCPRNVGIGAICDQPPAESRR